MLAITQRYYQRIIEIADRYGLQNVRVFQLTSVLENHWDFLVDLKPGVTHFKQQECERNLTQLLQENNKERIFIFTKRDLEEFVINQQMLEKDYVRVLREALPLAKFIRKSEDLKLKIEQKERHDNASTKTISTPEGNLSWEASLVESATSVQNDFRTNRDEHQGDRKRNLERKLVLERVAGQLSHRQDHGSNKLEQKEQKVDSENIDIIVQRIVDLKGTIDIKLVLEDTAKEYTELANLCEKLGDLLLANKAYMQAVTIYQFICTLQNNKLNLPTVEIQKKIFSTEQHFLNEILKEKSPQLKLDEYRTLNEKNKKWLQEIREKVKKSFAAIEKELGEGVPNDKKAKAEAMKELFQLIAIEMKSFLNVLLQECYNVLGKPPCTYAVIGFGSLAREEATPYSDLEWGVLIAEEQESHKVYFRHLTQLLHLKIINLGETLVGIVGIKGLGRFYDDITPRGFAFDAEVPGAYKTPLGNRDEHGNIVFELIHTPPMLL